jgi:hypothetical protein
MDKVAVVAKILQECVSWDVCLVAKQIDIILEALDMTADEKDLLAGEMLAWRVQQSSIGLEALKEFEETQMDV